MCPFLSPKEALAKATKPKKERRENLFLIVVLESQENL